MNIFRREHDPHKFAMERTGGHPAWSESMEILGGHIGELQELHARNRGIREGSVVELHRSTVPSPETTEPVFEPKNIRLVVEQVVEPPQFYDQDAEVS